MKTERKASVKTLIKEAELATAPNEFVYRFYFEQSKVGKESKSDDVDKFTEHRLLDKNDPFLDLTLAQYCFYPETLAYLFRKSKEEGNLPLTLACIANTTVCQQRFAFSKLPKALFTNSGKEAIEVWFKMIKNEEIDALFRNPTISDDFLTKVLQGKQLWSEMSDEQKSVALSALCNNPRIVTGYDNEMMDGWAEYSYGRVPDAIWHLAETLPVKGEWAVLLGELLDKVVGGCHGMDSLEVAKRWNKVDEEEQAEKKKQWLNPFESVRYALYKGTVNEPYGKDRAAIRKELLDNNDVAFRAAIYSQWLLTPDEIKSAYEKDALVAFQYTIDNMQIWKNPLSREALHDICWDADSRYNNNYLDCANHFNWKKKELMKKQPEWFVEKADDGGEAAVDETKQIVTVSLVKELLSDSNANPALQYLEAIHRIVSNASKEIDETKQKPTVSLTKESLENSNTKPALHYLEAIHTLDSNVDKTKSKLNWIFWGLIAVIVLELYKL